MASYEASSSISSQENLSHGHLLDSGRGFTWEGHVCVLRFDCISWDQEREREIEIKGESLYFLSFCGCGKTSFQGTDEGEKRKRDVRFGKKRNSSRNGLSNIRWMFFGFWTTCFLCDVFLPLFSSPGSLLSCMTLLSSSLQRETESKKGRQGRRCFIPTFSFLSCFFLVSFTLLLSPILLFFRWKSTFLILSLSLV